MKKIVLLGFVALSLSSCAALTTAETTISVASGVSVPASSALVAANTFDAIEIVATGYDKLPACGASAGLCRTPAGVAAIAPAIRTGRVARNQIRSLLVVGATTIPVVTYNTLAGAITDLQGLYSQYNIKSQ